MSDFILITDSEAAKEFGSKLKQARVLRNLKQTDLADQVKLGKNIISRFEAKGEGSIANLIPILRRLHLLDEFLNFIPQQTPDPKSIYLGTAPTSSRQRVKNKHTHSLQSRTKRPGDDLSPMNRTTTNESFPFKLMERRTQNEKKTIQRRTNNQCPEAA